MPSSAGAFCSNLFDHIGHPASLRKVPDCCEELAAELREDTIIGINAHNENRDRSEENKRCYPIAALGDSPEGTLAETPCRRGTS